MRFLNKENSGLVFLLLPFSMAYAADNCVNTTDADGKNLLSCSEIVYYYNSGLHGGLGLSAYDTVNITTTTKAGTSPLLGWGIYGNSSTYNFNNLIISTSGADADGIITKNGKSQITTNNLTITTTGSSADGINIGRESNGSIVTVNGDAVVSTINGMGLRANVAYNKTGVNTNTIIVKGNTSVDTQGSGSANGGYGVYAGIDSIYGGNDTAKIDLQGDSTVTTSGNTAHAIYANGHGYIRLNNVDVTTSGQGANGIFANAAQGLMGSTTAYGGVIDLLSDVSVTAQNGSKAIYASGKDSKVASFDSEQNQQASGVYTVNGDIVADKTAVVDLVMTDGSNITGVVNSNQYKADGTANSASNAGTVNLDISGANSIWNVTGNSVVSNLALDNSTVSFVAPTDMTDPTGFTGKTLTIAGNYTSNNGVLVMNSVLGGDSSPADMLIIKGDASGNTDVAINNIGGTGELTAQGIEIIKIEGVSTATFSNSKRIVAGSFDYFVRPTANNTWSLVSDYSPVPPVPPVPPVDPVDPIERKIDPIDPVDPVTPVDPVDPVVDPTPAKREVQPVYRPEVSGYTNNLAAANNMFVTRLHDRMGETQYVDAVTGEHKVTSMWLRNEGGHNRSRDTYEQLRTLANRYVLQLGGDIAQWSHNGTDGLHLGLMAGYANSKSRTESRVTGYTARASVNGYSTGVYGTWYANEADKSGLYVDSWLQYSWFNNSVDGLDLATEEYKSKGATASVESGYAFEFGKNAAKSVVYFIQPKAQLVWMGVKADDHKESNGTHVSGEGNGNIQTRLGVRASLRSYSDQDKSKAPVFEPFVEANWVHNTKDFGAKLDNISVKQNGAANIAELKVGLESQVNKNVNLWGNVNQQVGNHGYSDTAFMLGAKYSF
ncbi:hypothetical protein C9426_29665 [Serratia sp. S1B]|nr:hypothetical protein C9426_29665 [Serratia sp. S1B]